RSVTTRARPVRRLLVEEAVGDVPGVVLVDVKLPAEAEKSAVRAHEALDVRPRGKDLELLLLERADVLRANLRRELDLRIVEPLAHAGIAQAGAYLEHQPGILERIRSTSRGAATTRTSRPQSSPKARS